MPKVKYKYDSSLNPCLEDLDEQDDFEQDCSMEGLFLSYLQNLESPLEVWFKPDLWLMSYFGFSYKQLNTVLMLSRLRWSENPITIEELINNQPCQFNDIQREFLRKLFSTSSDFHETCIIDFNF
jgi:hypothetical protein